MTPIANDEDHKRPETEFLPLPRGYNTMIIEDAAHEATKKDGTPSPRIKVQFKPFLLDGNYGSVFLYLPISSPYNLLQLCEVVGLAKDRCFDPKVRMDAHPDNPNAWDEFKVAHNLVGRVCNCLIKPDTYQGKTKSSVDIFNEKESVFQQYFVNGEPYGQPPIVHFGEPPDAAPAPDQQTLAPPSDLVDPNEELEHTIEDV